MSLREQLEKAGIETDGHESDLYCKDTPLARQIIADSGWATADPFECAITGEQWLDVPFASISPMRHTSNRKGV